MIIKNLIYNEDVDSKIFKSENFNFIFDKSTFSSFSWGETEEITPLYNPISPEEINLILPDEYVFDKKIFFKLFNLNIDFNEIKKSNYTSVSCITSVNVFCDNFSNNENVKQLFNYLNELCFVPFLNIDFNKNISLRDIFKLKYLNVKNVILNVKTPSIDVISIIKLFLENDIFVKVKFIVSNEVFEKVFSIISNNEYPKQLLTLINFNKSFNKDNLKKLTKYLKENNLVSIVIDRNNFNKTKNYEMKSLNYRPGIDSCVIDLKNNKIYPSLENFEKIVNINDVNSIYDYWNSNVFKNFRKSIVSKLEKDLIKK